MSSLSSLYKADELKVLESLAVAVLFFISGTVVDLRSKFHIFLNVWSKCGALNCIAYLRCARAINL